MFNLLLLYNAVVCCLQTLCTGCSAIKLLLLESLYQLTYKNITLKLEQMFSFHASVTDTII